MPDPRDRREAERFPVNADTACGFVSPVVEEFGPARIKNISMEGIGIHLARAPKIGATLAVCLTNPARNFSKVFLVKVAHATQQPGGFLVGGTFTAPLTYDELKMLVM